MIALSYVDLTIASGFILLTAIFSLFYKLDLEKRILWAAFRTFGQLSLLGLVLKWIFAQDNPVFVLILLILMSLIAGREAVARLKRKYKFIFLDTFFTMTTVGFFVGFTVTQIILKIKPWYHPQYLIPIVGMILGNSLNGVSIALDSFLEHLRIRKEEIELFLVFGASTKEAIRIPMKESVRRGLIPIINAMSIAGVVSLPGMMTGQILAGAPPMQAVAYQILVMFMLAGSYALGSILAIFLASKRLITREGLLMIEKLNL